MCSASTIYSAIKASGIRAGEWAVFPGGGGGVGSQGVQLASAIGLRPIVVDTGAERRKLALELGAEHFVDFKEVKDPIEEVVALTEGGAHACFVTGESRHNSMSSSRVANYGQAVQTYPTALRYLGSRAGATLMWYVVLHFHFQQTSS